MKEEKEREAQQTLILYQLLQNHLEQLKNQAALFERRLMETEITKQTLNDLKKSKESDVLIPLGSGCYSHGSIRNSEKIITDVGAGIFVERETGQTNEILESNKTEIENLSKNLQDEINTTVKRLNDVALQIEQMQKDVKE